ncbi:MAG: GyrI-like domain-containing protein [Bacillota bacterium]
MSKIDFKKEFKELFNPPVSKVSVVDVPEMNFIMVDGKGDPNNSELFNDAVESLYSVAYSVKFSLKRQYSKASLSEASVTEDKAFPDYTVPPLEGLWWCGDNTGQFNIDDKETWKWTLMIMQPDFITPADIDSAVRNVSGKKKLESLRSIRFEKYKEGRTAQIMHIGPYADEAPSVKRLHCFIQENGYRLSGKHHEIYLSDPKKSKPEKMKTIIRQPFR